jgi:hypothetical protein
MSNQSKKLAGIPSENIARLARKLKVKNVESMDDSTLREAVIAAIKNWKYNNLID